MNKYLFSIHGIQLLQIEKNKNPILNKQNK
jgi:hypothetical protein